MLSSLGRSLLSVRLATPLSGIRLFTDNNENNNNNTEPPQFIPENTVEEIIQRAALDVSARPEFYRELLQSKLYVINEDGGEGEGQRTTKKDEKFRVRCVGAEGKVWVPIFTSLKRMAEFGQQNGARYLGAEAKVIFESMPEADFLLNPGSSFGKEMTKVEVKQLLSGELFGTEQMTIESGTEVQIGEPQDVPQTLLSSLSRFFSVKKDVKNAYFAEFVNPTNNKVEGLLAVTCDKENQSSILETISIITKSSEVKYEKPLVTVWLGTDNDVFDDFFATQTPFYPKPVEEKGK